MKRPKRLFLIITTGAVLAGIVFLSGGIGRSKERTIPYRTEKISRGTIAEFITATGTISPEEMVTVGTQVSGKITKLYVTLNDKVTAGQLLAEIDPSIAQTQLKQSKASLETSQLAYELAQRDYKRTQTLVAKEYVPKVELERAWQNVINSKTSLESAQIQVERDEVNLSYTKVTAPIDGIIIKQEASSGQTLASNFQTPSLFIIAKDMSVMKIDMNVPEADISKIRAQMPVKFTVDAFPDREFDGIIDTIDLNPNNQSGVVTYNVVVKLENKNHALLPGMTANISITLSEVTHVLRVPTGALRFSPPPADSNSFAQIFGNIIDTNTENEEIGNRIYIWQNNQLKRIAVIAGASDGMYFEARSAELKEGDIVVTGLRAQED